MVPQLIAGTVGLSVALLVIAMFRRNGDSFARQRVARLAPETEDPDPLAASFVQRIIQPLGAHAAGIMMVILPGRIVAVVRRQLQIAGDPISLRSFLIIWLMSSLALPLSILLLLLGGGSEPGRNLLFGFAFWVFLGAFLPWFFLRRKAMSRARAVQQRLPDAIDLIITNIEAGLGLQAALLAVSERMNGPVADEFGRAVREISLGRERTEVFENMAERSGVADMRLFARAVAQSERTGFPIARILRNHSVEIRERRRQVAKEKAAKVPVKIILPTAMFIFPTLFIVILGPIGIYAADLFE